jgi:hypothetical protein
MEKKQIGDPTFREICQLLKGEGPRKLIANIVRFAIAELKQTEFWTDEAGFLFLFLSRGRNKVLDPVIPTKHMPPSLVSWFRSRNGAAPDWVRKTFLLIREACFG